MILIKGEVFSTRTPYTFANDFTISYQGNFGNKDVEGADGMALVIKGNLQPELGNAGAGI